MSVWDVQAGRELVAPAGYTGTVGAVCFAPDGRMLAAGDAGASVTLWELASGKVRASFEGHHNLVGALAFAAGGNVLASGSHDDTVRLWDLRTGKTSRTLKGHARHVYSIALGRKGKLLVSGSEDRTIMFWDTSSGKELATIYEESPVWSVALTPDTKLLAAGVGKTIKIWDVDEVLKQGARQPRRPPPPAKDKAARPR
jgi:WD40 repeat protein